MIPVDDRLPKIHKREDADLNRFAQYLISKGVQKITILDKPDETRRTTSQNDKFDYLIEVDGGNKIALEFTQLFEAQAKIKQEIQWSNLVAAFHKEIERFQASQQKILWAGTWVIETPQNFGASRQRANNIAKKNVRNLLQAFEKGLDSAQINGIHLRLRKVVEQPTGEFHFMSSATVSLVTLQDVEGELSRLLPTKNKQLATMADKRYLVILNKHPFASTSGVVSVMSKIEALWSMKNLDRIYFEESPGHFSLIFSRDLVKAWLSTKLVLDGDFMFVFQLWLPNLRALDPGRTYNIVWRILKGRKGYEIFPDSYIRQEIVHLGEWLAEQKRLDDLCLLIDKFIDDPDPPDAGNYMGDPAFDYHQKIKDGEDPTIITTVRGHVSWLVIKLAIRKEYILRSLAYTQKLLSHENLYAKLQAIFPLIEIAARRQWLEEIDHEKYREFRDLAFDLLRKYSHYQAIASLLVHLFYYFKDLNTEEAIEVLKNLKNAREAGTLYVYFGIFRDRHYKNVDGGDKKNFKVEPLQIELQQAITNYDKASTDLKVNISWNLWKIIKDNPEELNTIKPYIDLFLQQPYNNEIYEMLKMIIEECFKIQPKIAISWFKELLDKISEFIANQDDRARIIWLTCSQEAIEVIAKEEPGEIVTIMRKLVGFWQQGAYIGDPSQLFATYKLIQKNDVRNGVKREFAKLYKSMKVAKPSLAEVDWT